MASTTITTQSDWSFQGSTTTTAGFGDDNNQHKVGRFGYGLGLSIGILVLITTITIASYFCTRDTDSSENTSGDRRNHDDNDNCVIKIEEGIDEATLKKYPKYTYSSLKKMEETNAMCMTTTECCCSICLADYKGDDLVRALLECNHVFHVKCVDPWLRIRPSCPVCRTSPLPTPLSTPLAEVVPLAATRL